MNVSRLIIAIWGLATTAVFQTARADSHPASSEIRKESNGFWLYIDGVKTPAFGGAVYQNTEGDLHILSYSNSMHSLYQPLDDESRGGSGHGARLEHDGFQAIRVYALPVNNADDVRHTKEILERLYTNHHIKVLVGDWAGLDKKTNFRSPHELSLIRNHLRRLVDTYCGEPWVLGWQIGNENNYHIRNGKLGHEIDMDPAEYYAFMDGLAGLVKEELGKRHVMQFVSLGQGDLTPQEAGLIAVMKNIDAVGINCYRNDHAGFDDLINMAAEQIPHPIYFAEIGKPAATPEAQQQQSQYLSEICPTIFAHSAGRLSTGNVLALFVHESTDEAWKQFERGDENDAHYGFFGKPAETTLNKILIKNREFSQRVLATNDGPDSLIHAAWGCIESTYARNYGREYGYAMAYATRAVMLYQNLAKAQQQQLINFKSPPEVAQSGNFWALNAVGTAYFIIGETWMLMSYDLKGNERPNGPLQKVLQLAEFQEHRFPTPDIRYGAPPTNSANCIFYAQQVFGALHALYPDANLQAADGSFWQLDHAVKSRFPELSKPYIPFTWQNCAVFSAAGVVLVLMLATVSRATAKSRSVPSKSVMGVPMRIFFLLALILNFASLFWFASWWFDPIRMQYYTVQPILFWVLTAIGATGAFLYLYFWYLLWNMRQPLPMAARPGMRVAIVTTRVASEPVESLEDTLEKMGAVTYPHDSYLLDEEDNEDAKFLCQKWGVHHFSRKGNRIYNQSSGKFQARTKGGNLNSWLYEFGHHYDFVTFLDPDHGPHPDFLDQVLGYFENPNVAFVQAPQVLYNRNTNWVARGAAEQSYFFYGPVQMGLFGIGACVVNGSHSTFRVNDLFSIKDECYAVHDADDILTSIRIHAAGKVGVYIPQIVAEGLAPDTWSEFSKQQRRWAYSMFQLLFHYYATEFRHMPWRCRLSYLVMTCFYFRGVFFAGLILMPFISAVTGNPPVNSHIAAFCLRYIPFFLFNCGVLLYLGRRYLIPGGSQKGFWFRAGILWIAMWWDNLCALLKAIKTGRVADRQVAAKWKPVSDSPWRAVRPHLVVMLAAIGTFAWIWSHADRRETLWGTLLFLGMIALSQGFIVYKVTRKPTEIYVVEQPRRASAPMAMSAVYSPQEPKL